MPTLTLPPPQTSPQWIRRFVFIEYEVSEYLSGLYVVRFPCGWGGTGATEPAAVADAIATVRFFKKEKWVDSLSERFANQPQFTPRLPSHLPPKEGAQ